MNTKSTPHDDVATHNSAADRPRRPSMTPERRGRIMCQMRAEGRSLAEIGDAFGLTRERARQIIRDAGGPGKAEVRAVRMQLRECDLGGHQDPRAHPPGGSAASGGA